MQLHHFLIPSTDRQDDCHCCHGGGHHGDSSGWHSSVAVVVCAAGGDQIVSIVLRCFLHTLIVAVARHIEIGHQGILSHDLFLEVQRKTTLAHSDCANNAYINWSLLYSCYWMSGGCALKFLCPRNFCKNVGLFFIETWYRWPTQYLVVHAQLHLNLNNIEFVWKPFDLILATS